MKADLSKIKWLLDNHSAYSISKSTGIGDTTISRWVTGKTPVDGMSLRNAITLTEYVNQLLRDDKTMWTAEEQARLTRYMDGDYADICEWSTYITSLKTFEPSHLTWTPNEISKEDKDLVTKIHMLISEQSVSPSPLYRFERARRYNHEIWYKKQVGDTIKVPIRSASRLDLMAKIDRQDGVVGLEKDDFYTNPNGNDYRFIEYRFLTSKSVDISKYAPEAYTDQAEELVAGIYRIVKFEEKERHYNEFEETRLSYAELVEREGLTVEHRISKKGNEIVAFEYNGKPMTCPADKMDTTFVTEVKAIPNQLPRKVFYLEWVSDL